MADFEINDIHQVGVVKDVKSHLLPPEVWSAANNMISKDMGMQAMKGYEPVFGTPLYAPHFALPLSTQVENFWLYTSLTKAAIYDGNAHTDITRLVGGDYAAPATRFWNGGIFAGIPILNNGVDKPQYWPGPPISNELEDLDNWPADASALIIRPFGAFLVALNWTISSVNYPHLVKWSNEATDPGTLPSSWDAADQAVDAGEYDLPDVESGVLIEARMLGSKMMLYKGQSTWQMRFVGGRAVFAFDTFSDTAGILTQRCVMSTGDGKKHLVATLEDIVLHDGNSGPVSVLENKMRTTLFRNLDQSNYVNSFMFRDLVNSNIIFAYPEPGMTEPNRGLVFNYRSGAITECDIGFCNASAGAVLEASGAETWDSVGGAWTSDTEPWNSFERRAVLLCDKATSQFHRWDVGYTRNGLPYAATLQRTGLAMTGKKRSGETIVNFQAEKFVDRIWPKISGGPVLVRLGYQQTVDGSVEWGPYVEFDPANDVTVDTDASGRAICIEFTTPEALEWKLDGYRLPIQILSEF